MQVLRDLQLCQHLLRAVSRTSLSFSPARTESTFSVDRSGLFQPEDVASHEHAHKEPETDMAKQIKALIQVLPVTNALFRHPLVAFELMTDC